MNSLSYEERLEIVERSIKRKIKQKIINNYGIFFEMWLSSEADMELGAIYVNEFKGQFAQYINNTIEDKIYFAANNIIYFISAIKNPEMQLEELLEKVESFIDNQISDFGNWCEDIGSVMFDEIGEDEWERRASNRNSNSTGDKNRR